MFIISDIVTLFNKIKLVVKNSNCVLYWNCLWYFKQINNLWATVNQAARS